MSAPSGPPAGAGGKPPTDRREKARTVALIGLAVLMTLFAVLNLEKVEVNWIFGSGKVPLIIVIVISALLGVAFTYMAERRRARRRR